LENSLSTKRIKRIKIKTSSKKLDTGLTSTSNANKSSLDNAQDEL